MRISNSALAVASVGVLLAVSTSVAQTTVLYDGAIPTTPDAQGWLVSFIETGGVHSTSGGKTSQDTTSDNGIRGGFTKNFLNPLFPTLNRTTGYTVRFDARVLDEAHASDDRAGLSLIVLSDDNWGIELSFWENEVWTQSGPDFQKAESESFNTTAAITSYELTIQGSTYSLTANGLPLLSDNLRNYSSFGLPYDLENYLFIGDNTTSAAGNFEFDYLSITVPEPSAIATGAIALILLVPRRRH